MLNFGLIGHNLTHSFSVEIHKKLFVEKGLDCSYSIIDLEGDFSLREVFKEYDLTGVNVTIPYKKSVLPQLDFVDQAAQMIGAVNTIVLREGRFCGYNTDWRAFYNTLIDIHLPHNTSAIIFGNGGAAAAVKYALERLGVPYIVVERKDGGFEALKDDMIRLHNLLINATPVGMFPHINDCLPINYGAVGEHHIVYDLIYNPEKTLFMLRCEAQGADVYNGYEMLVEQAALAQEIFLNEH